VTHRYENNQFFTRKDGRLWAAPLFVVLLAIESSDIIFAADSIPAIFAITPTQPTPPSILRATTLHADASLGLGRS
jgi:predicted tellurium resistance membrane protein TerC